MLGNFFRRQTDQKQRANKKLKLNFLTRINKTQKVEIDCPASGGGKGKYVKYVRVPCPPLDAALSILSWPFFLFKKNTFF